MLQLQPPIFKLDPLLAAPHGSTCVRIDRYARQEHVSQSRPPSRNMRPELAEFRRKRRRMQIDAECPEGSGLLR